MKTQIIFCNTNELRHFETDKALHVYNVISIHQAVAYAEEQKIALVVAHYDNVYNIEFARNEKQKDKMNLFKKES